jgi:glycine cleavage system H protein
MPSELIFMMGKYEARFPTDRRYSDNHLWLLPDGDAGRVGFTAYSVRLLQDVYFLDWSIDPDTRVQRSREIGQIESSKAVSSLHAPADGTVLQFNEDLLSDPSAINVDGYGGGWLYQFRTDATLMTADEYVAHLAAVWEDTQRMIKGQLNE